MDVAQLVRLPNKTDKVMGSTPTVLCVWHPIYDIILPLRPPPLRTRSRFLWITFMKCSNYVWGMLEMMCRLPCCFGDQVPFPKDKVLKLATEETRVENGVDLIFFSGCELERISDIWWGSRRETWNTLWIWKWDGRASRKATGLMHSMIQNGPNFF